MTKLELELKIETAIRDISEKTQHALRESPYNTGAIAERMQMGSAALVESVLNGGGIQYMQMATLIRLVTACGLEMHVKFVPSIAEEEGRVIRGQRREPRVDIPVPGTMVDDDDDDKV